MRSCETLTDVRFGSSAAADDAAVLAEGFPIPDIRFLLFAAQRLRRIDPDRADGWRQCRKRGRDGERQ